MNNHVSFSGEANFTKNHGFSIIFLYFPLFDTNKIFFKTFFSTHEISIITTRCFANFFTIIHHIYEMQGVLRFKKFSKVFKVKFDPFLFPAHQVFFPPIKRKFSQLSYKLLKSAIACCDFEKIDFEKFWKFRNSEKIRRIF